MTEDDEIFNLYTQLKTNWQRYKPLWDDISRVTGITVQPDYMWSNATVKDQQVDEYVDDPTSAISVNQAGDYLLGILWGTGQGIVDVIPSRYVEEEADPQVVAPWYSYATNQFEYHMNHTDCGYNTALRPYCYDQFSFGTSGIGLFKNSAYVRGIEDNALIARNYGIDNTCILEGKNQSPDIGSTTYRWMLHQIMGEFCCTNGAVDPKKVATMPRAIQSAINAQDHLREFNLVFLWRPRKEFDPRLMGIRGAKYEGFWFLDGEGDRKIFYRESFHERPINMARAIKVRGEVYGRSSGTLLLSSIRATNFMFAITSEILEKMANPALGAMGGSIFGDSVLDTSPNGLTIFNSTLNSSQSPVFPLYDVGNPEPIISFLMPYLNEKIVTAFKIDALLDFNSAKDMTATESLQRYNIRGKSLAGLLGMQKAERLIPDCKRALSILWDVNALGINPRLDPDRAMKLSSRGKFDRIIPEAVLNVQASGKPWYELRFNNELEKLLRTENIQALSQIIQGVTAIAALYPPIVEAIKWYDLLKALNDNLNPNEQILVTAVEFKKIIQQAAQRQQMAQQAALAESAGTVMKDSASAVKSRAEAQEVMNGKATK